MLAETSLHVKLNWELPTQAEAAILSPQGQGAQSPAGSGSSQKVRRENKDQGPTCPQPGRKEGWGAHLPPFVPFPLTSTLFEPHCGSHMQERS